LARRFRMRRDDQGRPFLGGHASMAVDFRFQPYGRAPRWELARNAGALRAPRDGHFTYLEDDQGRWVFSLGGEPLYRFAVHVIDDVQLVKEGGVGQGDVVLWLKRMIPFEVFDGFQEPPRDVLNSDAEPEALLVLNRLDRLMLEHAQAYWMDWAPIQFPQEERPLAPPPTLELEHWLPRPLAAVQAGKAAELPFHRVFHWTDAFKVSVLEAIRLGMPIKASLAGEFVRFQADSKRPTLAVIARVPHEQTEGEAEAQTHRHVQLIAENDTVLEDAHSAREPYETVEIVEDGYHEVIAQHVPRDCWPMVAPGDLLVPGETTVCLGVQAADLSWEDVRTPSGPLGDVQPWLLHQHFLSCCRLGVQSDQWEGPRDLVPWDFISGLPAELTEFLVWDLAPSTAQPHATG
jgi:hypothetical protein